MAKESGHKQTKAQLQRVIERLVAEADRLWDAIEQGRAASKAILQCRKKIKQLDPNSPETKSSSDKLSKDQQKLRDQWREQLKEFRKLKGEVQEPLRQCGRWPVVEGQIDKFYDLQERWREALQFCDLPRPSIYLEDMDVVQPFLGKLKALLSDTYSKLASEDHDDAQEPSASRAVGEEATTPNEPTQKESLPETGQKVIEIVAGHDFRTQDHPEEVSQSLGEPSPEAVESAISGPSKTNRPQETKTDKKPAPPKRPDWWRQKPTFTVKEAAEVLVYTPRYIYKLVEEGKLTRAVMSGKSRSAVRIKKESIETMLETKKV